ncbi:MAG: PAS domain S-box protein [Chloroflexota bacterium]
MNASHNDPAQDGRGAFPQFEKRILDTSSVGVMITRLADGTILYANQAIARLFGVPSVDVIVGKLVPDFYWDANDRITVVNRLRAEGSVSSYDLRARRSDESMIWVSISVQPFDYAGEPAALSEITDISLRKQAEDDLKRNVNFTTALLDAVPTPVFYKDKLGFYQGCNRAFTEFMGRSAEEIRGKTVHELWPSENAEVYHQKDLDLMRSREHQIYEAFVTDKDGSARPVIFAKDVFFDEVGDVAGLVGAFVDITERRKAEGERLRLQSMMEQINDGIALADLSGNILYTNPAWAKMHGYEPDEIIGKSLSIFHTREQLERDVLPFNEKVMSTGFSSGEIGHVRRDGTTFPTFMTTSIQKDQGGAPVGLIGTARDITENKRLEREVQLTFERRGYQVQVSNEISQEVAAAAELDGLFERVVTLTKERLGYYHTQLLRYNAEQDAVVLIRGYGETGQKMLAGGHKMPMGSGLIGTAAASGVTVMRPTLADDPDWQPNPLLPETRGEIAVPIKWQENILGVLDVQSDTAGALGEDDRLLLESLCGQIAVAIHSAELLEELRVSRERYELSIAGSNDGLWDWDMSTNAVYFSPRWKEMIGYGEDELNNGFADFESLLHPEDHDRVLAYVNDYLTGKIPNYDTEFRFHHKDGSYRWIRARGVVVRNAEGVPLRMAGSHTDITERRKIQENMLEALEVAHLANWEYDVEKDLFTFNDQFYSIFHTTAEKVGGYQITSAQYAGMFVYPEDAPLVGAEIGKALSATERVYNKSLDHRILYADGGIGYITVKVTVERDENGNITRFYGANQDITERKQAEEALRFSQARLSEAAEIAQMGYWEFDLLTDTYTFTDQFYTLLRTTAEREGGYQMSSREYAQKFLPPNASYLVGSEIQKSLESVSADYVGQFEHPFIRADGTEGYVAGRSRVIKDAQGRTIKTFGFNQDITERKLAEEALRRSQQTMAERLEEINRLYQAMSHEGWKAYRQREALPAGFVFDQSGVHPLEDQPTDGQFTQVPLKVLGGEVVGNLAIAHDPEYPLSQDDLAFLQQVSDQVALALEGARLSAQTQSALAQTEKLSEVGLLFNRAADLQELVKIAAEALAIPAINRAALETFTYNADNQVTGMDVIANWWSGEGNRPTAIGTHYTAEILPLLSLFLTPVANYIRDAFHDERVDEISMQIIQRLNVRAVAVLPLFLADRQLGVLLLESEQPYDFTQEDIRLFSAMGPQLSTVLENRRQFERAQKQAERESALNLISQKIQSATTVEAVLQIAARELGHVLGAPMTIAQLGMKEKK